jgi:hypothetical protein
MSQFVTESNIILEPCDAFWGVRKEQAITCVADVSGSLNNDWFKLYYYDSNYDLISDYVWFNVNSAGVDPDPVGYATGHVVALATNATAAQVATALAAVLDAIDGINSATVDPDNSAKVLMVHYNFGDATAADNGTASPGFTFAETVEGTGGKLGATDGGVEIKFDIKMVDVKSDQTGDQLLDQINNATNVTVSMTMLETTTAMIKDLIGDVMGDTTTPGGGTEVIGFGESKRFSNIKQYAGELRLIPVGASDRLRMHTCWKAVPVVESMTFKGTEVSKLPLKFNCFRDVTKLDEINVWAFGDTDQDLDA